MATKTQKREESIAGHINCRLYVKPFGNQLKMTATLIIKCNKCGNYILSSLKQKTKLCPYCGTKVNLNSVQRIAATENAFEASEMLRKLKSEKGFNHNP